jgi:cytochrome c-type biogenesis protein CcmE
MKAIHKKLLVGGILLAGALGYLGFASAKSGWVYYVDVGQFWSDPKYQSQRVKVSGRVLAEGLVSNPAGLNASFTLDGHGKQLAVHYRGVIPDLFAADRDVVVEGRMDAAGVFQADQLLTKCASKYEAQSASPGQEHPGSINRSGE